MKDISKSKQVKNRFVLEDNDKDGTHIAGMLYVLLSLYNSEMEEKYEETNSFK